ncbi:MAG: glycosyltransferase family 4 protein [Bacteroidaceae bacterium]|nr:glycosyltransferase family 4 protein [Bacteroidaceae bacterium]
MKKRNPRVLLVCPLPPPVHGSSMVSSCIRESRLINGAFDVDCVNISTSRGMAEIGRFHFAKIWRFVGSYFIMLWKLLTHRYDLVYLAVTVHGIGFLKDCPYMLMARLFCRNRLIHHHNKGMAPYAGRFPYNWLMPMAYRGAKVMLLSERLYEDISGVVKREDIIICPNGLKEAPKADGLNIEKRDDRVEILYLSNLVGSKGVFVLLDALARLKERGVVFHSSFVGGMSKSVSVESFSAALAERGLTEDVAYLGTRFGDDKWRCMYGADLYVLPSMDDCLPLTVIEAMQVGLPVVTTDMGAIPDLVVDGVNGFVISSRKLIVESGGRYLDWEPSEDIARAIADYRADGGASGCEVLADRLECLIRDAELRRRMGDAGRKRYEELFTLEVFEERVKEAFNLVNE